MILDKNQWRRQSGFTLIEVMVALAIFAVAAVALMRAGMSYVNAVEGLETRTLAHFVAMNEAANITLTQAWLDGSAEHNVEEQGRHWQISTKATPIAQTANVRRVEITVAPIIPETDKPGDAVTTLVVFIHSPVA
ncbi:MAG: type II secretion system minor pseudopilin GspI [Gammaproteobacteria bacterium]|nr:type II secretion system minor pseudopilin GspI [Gammaproteobacteria bacterium]